MAQKIYPIIVVAYNGPALHFKLVFNQDQYDAFCAKYKKPESKMQEIKTLEALFRQRFNYW